MSPTLISDSTSTSCRSTRPLTAGSISGTGGFGQNSTAATPSATAAATAPPISAYGGFLAGGPWYWVAYSSLPGGKRWPPVGVGVRGRPLPDGGRRIWPDIGPLTLVAGPPPEIEKPSARSCSDELWLGSACRRANRLALLTTAVLRSRVNSRRSAKRSSRFFASILSTTGWKSRNWSGSGGGGCVRCDIRTAIGVSAWNGGAPVRSS